MTEKICKHFFALQCETLSHFMVRFLPRLALSHATRSSKQYSTSSKAPFRHLAGSAQHSLSTYWRFRGRAHCNAIALLPAHTHETSHQKIP